VGTLDVEGENASVERITLLVGKAQAEGLLRKHGLHGCEHVPGRGSDHAPHGNRVGRVLQESPGQSRAVLHGAE
jgi:hypothetical protein